MESPKFQGYSAATRDCWGRELRLAERPDTLGALSIHEIRPALVQRFLDGLANRPGKAVASLAVLKQVEKWALVRDRLPYPITTGCEVEGSDGGHEPWSDEQVMLAEAYAKPHLARIITLAANTGQRGSDLVKMRWTDVEEYEGRRGVNVVQQKTGREVWIPLTETLERAMEDWNRQPGFIALGPTGTPWARKQLSDAWGSERDSNPALAPLSEAGLHLHGLRATVCIRLKRAGATILQIADMVRMSPAMVARYCRLSVQRENALAAVVHLDRTARERRENKSKKISA